MQRLSRVAATAALTLVALTACNATPPKSAPAATSNAPASTVPKSAEPSPVSVHATSDARLKNADGTEFTLADVPGKAKVVNFWATWCAPCIGEMPVLNAMSKKYASKGVTFVAVSVDEGGPADVEPMLKRGRVKIDFRMAFASLAEKPFGVEAPIPDTYVFDGQNRLVKHFDEVIDEQKLEAAIAEALGSSAK